MTLSLEKETPGWRITLNGLLHTTKEMVVLFTQTYISYHELTKWSDYTCNQIMRNHTITATFLSPDAFSSFEHV